MNLAQLSRLAQLGQGRISAANNAGDGSGTITTIFTMPFKAIRIANITASSDVVVDNWSHISNDKTGRIINGDIVNLLAAASQSGIALNTDYTISGLVVNASLDQATFKLLDSSFAQLTITTTSPVFGFNFGGRVEILQAIAAQATKAAVSAKVVSFYLRPRNGSYRKLGDLAMTTHTPSATIIATLFQYALNQPLQSGDSIGASISVYSGVQDQTDILAFGSQY